MDSVLAVNTVGGVFRRALVYAIFPLSPARFRICDVKLNAVTDAHGQAMCTFASSAHWWSRGL